MIDSIDELQKVLKEYARHENQTIQGLTLDSRQVKPGWVYFALPGTHTHGASFALQAKRKGAIGIITDKAGAAIISSDLTPIIVDNPRVTMAEVAAEFYGHPADKMLTFGITGTNGKTTTTFLLAAGLQFANKSIATIGTIGFQLDGKDINSANRTTITTPEAIDLQALLHYLTTKKAEAVAMEISSHALAQDRVAGITFDVAGFINLQRDHLDYHKTVDAYFQAKARLFEPGRCRSAVINIDDEHGRILAEQLRKRKDVCLITVGHHKADYRIVDWKSLGMLDSVVRVATPSGIRTLPVSLPGEFNALDAVVAYAMLEQADIHCGEEVFSQIQIPGRMQEVYLAGNAPKVIVDFAHTPQAVAAALKALAGVRDKGQLIAILGSGGERDQNKRGLMGAAAVANADQVFITDDNPRNEDPSVIRAAILAGANKEIAENGIKSVVYECADRALAIKKALLMAGPDDLVAVLGKGHEKTQIVKNEIIDFDDVKVIKQSFNKINKER